MLSRMFLIWITVFRCSLFFSILFSVWNGKLISLLLFFALTNHNSSSIESPAVCPRKWETRSKFVKNIDFFFWNFIWLLPVWIIKKTVSIFDKTSTYQFSWEDVSSREWKRGELLWGCSFSGIICGCRIAFFTNIRICTKTRKSELKWRKINT
jgi:hypothetical protein